MTCKPLDRVVVRITELSAAGMATPMIRTTVGTVGMLGGTARRSRAAGRTGVDPAVGFFQQNLVAQIVAPHGIHLDQLHGNDIPHMHYVFHGRYAFPGQVADVHQPLLAGEKFHESPEIGDPDDFALVNLPHFGLL